MSIVWVMVSNLCVNEFKERIFGTEEVFSRVKVLRDHPVPRREARKFWLIGPFPQQWNGREVTLMFSSGRAWFERARDLIYDAELAVATTIDHFRAGAKSVAISYTKPLPLKCASEKTKAIAFTAGDHYDVSVEESRPVRADSAFFYPDDAPEHILKTIRGIRDMRLKEGQWPEMAIP